MPGKYRVKLVAETVNLLHKGSGNFQSVRNLGNGAFPVETEVIISLEQNKQGTPPLNRGEKKPATIELFARLKPKPSSPNPTAPQISLGRIDGQIELKFDPQHTPEDFPFFDCHDHTKPRPNNTDFVPPDKGLVEISDWIMDLRFDTDSFIGPKVSPTLLRLPWVFDDLILTEPVIQINARLTIAGTVETDVSGANLNTPIEIHLKHTNVPDRTMDTPKLLTFFGVRNLYTMDNAVLGNNHLPFKGKQINVFLHMSLRNSLPIDKSALLIVTLLVRAGFDNISISTPTEQEFGRFFKQIQPSNGTAACFMSINVQPGNERNVADALDQGIVLNIENSEDVNLPFFDFYVVGEARDQNGDELAVAEGLAPHVDTATATKAVSSPIRIIMGRGETSGAGLRSFLRNKIQPADHPNAIANLIVHEIGHTLGLRHMVHFGGAPPYNNSPDDLQRGVMSPGLSSESQVGTNLKSVRLAYFGPVHMEAIRQRFFLPPTKKERP